MMMAPPVALLTVDRTLRAFDDLDAVDVEEFAAKLQGTELQDTVDDRRNRRLTVSYLGDAPDAEKARADTLRRGKRDVRRQCDEILDALDAGVLDHLRIECGHGERGLERRLAAAPGGHDDLLERADAAARGRRSAHATGNESDSQRAARPAR